MVKLHRAHNFSPGPAVLPEAVLVQAQAEMLDYRGTGMSVMELSHRSATFQDILDRAEASLRRLMGISGDYHVLFMQGGAYSQISMVPLNLGQKGTFDYVETGIWAEKAAEEAARYGKVRVVASSKDKQFSYIPDLHADAFDPAADYVHITTNNTIAGTVYPLLPDTGHVPLVADMSSDILSRPYPVSEFGLIYAGAQKNIGPAGLTIVIVRKDLMGQHAAQTPVMYQYQTYAAHGSMYNTPPTYGIYLAGLVFDWLEAQGGVEAMWRINEAKAALLYDFLDRSQVFYPVVQAPYRSLMNVCFRMRDESLEQGFLAEADRLGLTNLKGHRLVGGMRASIYNALPVHSVQALIDFMADFEVRHVN